MRKQHFSAFRRSQWNAPWILIKTQVWVQMSKQGHWEDVGKRTDLNGSDLHFELTYPIAKLSYRRKKHLLNRALTVYIDISSVFSVSDSTSSRWRPRLVLNLWCMKSSVRMNTAQSALGHNKHTVCMCKQDHWQSCSNLKDI